MPTFRYSLLAQCTSKSLNLNTLIKLNAATTLSLRWRGCLTESRLSFQVPHRVATLHPIFRSWIRRANSRYHKLDRVDIVEAEKDWSRLCCDWSLVNDAGRPCGSYNGLRLRASSWAMATSAPYSSFTNQVTLNALWTLTVRYLGTVKGFISLGLSLRQGISRTQLLS